MSEELFESLLPALVARGRELLLRFGGIDGKRHEAAANDVGRASATSLADPAARDRAAGAKRPGRGLHAGGREAAAAVELGCVDGGL